MIFLKYIFIPFLILGTTAHAQQTPGNVQSETITIVGATAHLGNGQVIENSVLVFDKGKLVTVTEKTTYSGTLSGANVIDASGKHVYPGFIAANSTLGLVEVDAVRASDDQQEMGQMLPHIRSLIAYNAESKVVESMRPNGVLLAQSTPQGGRISGTSSVVQLDAWNWEDAAVKSDDGIHLNWPRTLSYNRNWETRSWSLESNKDYAKEVLEIEQFFEDSKAYLEGNRSPVNLPFQAMSGLFEGKQNLYVHVNDEKGITDAVGFAKKHQLKLVLVDAEEAYKLTDLLKNEGVGVLLSNTHRLPGSQDQDYDMPYKLPKLLSEAGVLVGLHTGGKANFQSRNLPFFAGQAVGQGLDKETALSLITANTAKILGIDADYGTLEVGKSATLFVSEGDALDMMGNQVIRAFIDGREISLETHQTELWQRYKKKFESN